MANNEQMKELTGKRTAEMRTIQELSLRVSDVEKIERMHKVNNVGRTQSTISNH